MSNQPFTGPALEKILGKLGPLTRETVFVEDRTFFICRPEYSDGLLDHPDVHAAFDADEYMPYWADLWPAARMLAKAVLHEAWTPGIEALEVGCGLGLPGVVALARGLRVIFTDYDPCALRFAADNARFNGFEDFRTLQLDWRNPPADWRVPVILGSDLIYELRNVEPLVAFVKQVLAPAGVCLLTDQDRIPSHAFKATLDSQGLAYTTKTMHAGEPGGRRLKGTLYRITR
jgi:predicted nicotinamide N-methyase